MSILTAVGGPALVVAETGTADGERFVGSYRYANTERHGRALIERAFEPAIEQLDLITRTVARRKMRRTNTLSKTINIGMPDGQISVEYVGEKSFRFTSRPGVTSKATAPNGNEIDLTQRIVGQAIEQVFIGPKGTTRNRLTLSKNDRQLTYHSVIRGKQLTTPITIDLVYRRRSGD